jgi:ribosomal protein S18 acetylase RimI-like enzyme
MISWRPTTDADVAYVMGLEHDPANSAYVTQWTREEHLATLGNPDERHVIVERDGVRVGFVILADLTLASRVRQILRIVIDDKGKGIGRATLREAARICFEEHGAARVWLDVREGNARARHLYESEGYVFERRSETEPGLLILSLSQAPASRP